MNAWVASKRPAARWGATRHPNQASWSQARSKRRRNRTVRTPSPADEPPVLPAVRTVTSWPRAASARLVSTTMRSAPRRTSGHAYGWVMAILIGPYADRPHRIDDRWGCRDAAAVPDEL